MSKYRLLEVSDSLINDGKPFWRVEKKILCLWWSEYFEEHHEWGATFYDKEKAIHWYEYHIDKKNRITSKVIAQN